MSSIFINGMVFHIIPASRLIHCPRRCRGIINMAPTQTGSTDTENTAKYS